MTTSIRPDRRNPATMNDDSWFVHGGNQADRTTGAIRTPVVMANSYRLPEDPTTFDEADYDALVYTRESGANQLGLQTKLAALDHAERRGVRRAP